MDLLSKIINDVVNDSVKLVTLLRQCLILADQLNNDSLREWVIAELNGYPDHTSMPEYRTVQIIARGIFLGPMGSQINNQPLHGSVMESEHQWWARVAYLKESVSSYERLAENPDAEGCAVINWPADMTAYYQDKFMKGYSLNRAWQEVPLGAIVCIVDSVRTRILQFALQIQRDFNRAGQDRVSSNIIESAVQTIIYGGTNIINSTIGDNAQFGGQKMVIEGDFSSLAQYLNDLGIPSDQIGKLKEAIVADQADGAKKGFGSRAAGWLQSAGTFIGKEGAKAASGATGKALTTAVLGYFGIAS